MTTKTGASDKIIMNFKSTKFSQEEIYQGMEVFINGKKIDKDRY